MGKKQMLNLLRSQFLEWGLGKDLSEDLAALVALAVVAFVALLAHRLARGPLLRGSAAIIHRTDFPYDDVLIECRVLHRLAHLVPGLVFYHLGPMALEGHPVSVKIIQTAAHVYLVLSGLLAVEALISAGVSIYNSTRTSHEVSIKGPVQFLKIILFLLGSIVVIATLIGQSPLYLLGGLTAMTAVLLLVFRDSILGLVAGIQISVNRMVAYGDWIEMPQYGVDGDVIDITLTTVKVQNWDKTITTHSHVRADWRVVQKLARDAGVGRAADQAGDPPRRQHHRVFATRKCSPASPKSSTSPPTLSARSKS